MDNNKSDKIIQNSNQNNNNNIEQENLIKLQNQWPNFNKLLYMYHDDALVESYIKDVRCRTESQILYSKKK